MTTIEKEQLISKLKSDISIFKKELYRIDELRFINVSDNNLFYKYSTEYGLISVKLRAAEQRLERIKSKKYDDYLDDVKQITTKNYGRKGVH